MHLLMKKSAHLLLSFAVFLIFIIKLGYCEIKDVDIDKDSRPMIMFEGFGFGPNGHVDISVNRVSWKTKHQNAKLNLSSMGFFLVSEESYPRILNESSYTEGFCLLSSMYVQIVFRFDNLTRPDSKFSASAAIDDADEYYLMFGNCQTEFHVSMKVHTEMYNIGDQGKKDFLPAGQTGLPRMYFLFFVVYAAILVIWCFICIRQRFTVQKIHLIMAALLLFKALKMICASEDKMYIRKTGTPHGWDVAFYIFGFLKGVTLFIVIVLIGTGWSFLKPFLQEREKNVLMFVIPLQVLENIASVVISETGPVKEYWLSWNEMFLLIDVICCCTVIFPIFWSINSLKETSKTDGKAAKNLEKLTLFRQFYIVVVAYLYFTRVVVSVIGANISYIMDGPNNATLAQFQSKIFQIFLDFMTRITKFEELVNAGNSFLVSFRQGLDFLRRPPLNLKSELIGQIIKANQSKRLSSYLEAGCVNTHDSKQNISKLRTCHLGLSDCLNQGKGLIKELESLLDDAKTVIEDYNEDLTNLQDKIVHCNLDSSGAIANKEEQPLSDLQKPDITDYAILMGLIYGMVKQDYDMQTFKWLQEKIISSLSLKSSSVELESYCLMWSLRPFVDDDIMSKAWKLVK
ncbi:OLC1v1025866C1 [Oldenlandia corymbosa var. corymbosa]|uniref:OLC1v1025866C1 n=1 Tax=Oldenlandia corymbosa var. corymbosa TaxID=529605 RepID=A0AAV1C6K8_OLDCO|nr:OLC1v1025866C1 [Oldenlandia corymbosa var. corymbosa]